MDCYCFRYGRPIISELSLTSWKSCSAVYVTISETSELILVIAWVIGLIEYETSVGIPLICLVDIDMNVPFINQHRHIHCRFGGRHLEIPTSVYIE